jgi:hypothetical protein
MKKRLLSLLLVALLLVLLRGTALAQAYTFNIPAETVHVFWNDDGSASLDYVIVFNNDPGAHTIDYVDLGLPNPAFDDSSIIADVNGIQVHDISRSGFQGSGPGVAAGVAIGLGSQTIAPGNQGTVHAHVGKVANLLQSDSQKGYASAVFSPAWFTTAHGETNLTVVFHFPKSVTEKDATYHASQPGWTDQPLGSTDDGGLVIFVWTNPKALMNQKIDFGASFPSAGLTTALPSPASTSTQLDNSWLVVVIIFVGLALLFWYARSKQSKAAYEPPKISVEGYGVKRGLTAVEAAVLLKEPVDKILTMILFSVVKKGAAQVINSDPLEIKVDILKDLEPYEISFLEAFTKGSSELIQQGLELTLGGLFRHVNAIIQGFDRQQSIDHYHSIVQSAWVQVEAADTPEVTGQTFEENLDWALLDQEYAPRTQRLFENKQVTLPVWWLHLDPSIHHLSTGSLLTPQGSIPDLPRVGGTPSGNISLPVLPGADFAASIVRSAQDFSSKVIGDINTFTQSVIQKSAPPPLPPTGIPSLFARLDDYEGEPQSEPRSSWSADSPGEQDGFSGLQVSHHSTYHPHSSGGGHHCACACAGGGR